MCLEECIRLYKAYVCVYLLRVETRAGSRVRCMRFERGPRRVREVRQLRREAHRRKEGLQQHLTRLVRPQVGAVDADHACQIREGRRQPPPAPPSPPAPPAPPPAPSSPSCASELERDASQNDTSVAVDKAPCNLEIGGFLDVGSDTDLIVVSMSQSRRRRHQSNALGK